MENLTYQTDIAATAAQVWKALWEDQNYKSWTSAFAEGSSAQTDWKKGSKVLFTDGSGSGMVSRIADLVPNAYMSFEHLGELRNNQEIYDSTEVKKWAGMHENYTLTEKNGHTQLHVLIETKDMNDEKMLDYFKQTWPKALEKLKDIAEKIQRD